MIKQELQRLKNEGIPMTLCQKGTANQVVKVREMLEKKTFTLVVFEKGGEHPISREVCLFFYKTLDFITRGFQGAIIENIGNNFSMAVPSEIFELTLRKFPRVSTPDNSQASFTQVNKTHIINCNVLDISLQGAMLAGNSRMSFKKGDEIGPITLDLFLSLGSNETRVQIKRATVMNVIVSQDGTQTKLGVFFAKDEVNQDDLENYIDIRTIEESVINK